jgi:2-C-methyl-D-erythritol 4-phosphate cytidylyltransferase/2-C-methyl-D-erythritol 2,4-cyclodiphosphate synthase
MGAKMAKTAALIVAGGSGSRAGGGLPKQYRPLDDVPMLRRTVEGFLACHAISAAQVVIGHGHEEAYGKATTGLRLCPAVTGGDTRQESVRRGLAALVGLGPDFVLIHEAVVAALHDGAEAALPLLPVPDSLRRIEENSVGSFLPRDGVCRVQTPQGFVFSAIREAHERFAGSDATDDITLAERAGLNIVAVPGEEMNFKVTTPQDFEMAERVLAGGRKRASAQALMSTAL